MAQVTDARVDDLLRVFAVGGQFFEVLGQGATQAEVFTHTFITPLGFVLFIDVTQAGVPFDVQLTEPARQRRQVMRAGSGQGLIGPVEDRLELTVVLFEQQHAHAQNRSRAEFLAEPFRNGAEIFAQHDCLMPPGFKAQQAQHVVEREVEVGTLAGRRTLRDDPQALQPHDVVDTQPACMGEVGTQHLDECPKPVALEAIW